MGRTLSGVFGSDKQPEVSFPQAMTSLTPEVGGRSADAYRAHDGTEEVLLPRIACCNTGSRSSVVEWHYHPRPGKGTDAPEIRRVVGQACASPPSRRSAAGREPS